MYCTCGKQINIDIVSYTVWDYKPCKNLGCTYVKLNYYSINILYKIVLLIITLNAYANTFVMFSIENPILN